MPKLHFQRPLLIKYLTGGAVISLLVCLMLAALYGAQAAQYRERLSTVHESGARKAAERALVRNARSLAATLSTGLAVPIHESNLPAVGQLLRRALANPDVEFVLVSDGQGRARHNGEAPLDASAQSVDAVLPEWCDTRGQGIALNLTGGLCVSDLVLEQHVVVGSVFVGLNSNSVEADVAEGATDANSVFDQLRPESLFGLMVLSLIGLMLGLKEQAPDLALKGRPVVLLGAGGAARRAYVAVPSERERTKAEMSGVSEVSPNLTTGASNSISGSSPMVTRVQLYWPANCAPASLKARLISLTPCTETSSPGSQSST